MLQPGNGNPCMDHIWVRLSLHWNRRLLPVQLASGKKKKVAVSRMHGVFSDEPNSEQDVNRYRYAHNSACPSKDKNRFYCHNGALSLLTRQ